MGVFWCLFSGSVFLWHFLAFFLFSQKRRFFGWGVFFLAFFVRFFSMAFFHLEKGLFLALVWRFFDRTFFLNALLTAIWGGGIFFPKICYYLISFIKYLTIKKNTP